MLDKSAVVLGCLTKSQTLIPPPGFQVSHIRVWRGDP
jgi:hypothetical protein